MALKNLVITHTNPKSPVSEAYRMLRTNIQFSGIDKPLKRIVVTSADPHEGKTTTIANLAVAFAQSCSKTLLIDVDFRRPRIHEVFGLFNCAGMSNVLAHQKGYKECLRMVNVENLEILTSGPIPPNPSEMLSSKSMLAFLEEVRSEYDIILLDAPPVGMVTDAAILSTITDGTILVAHSGKVEIAAIQRAKESLEKVNANIIGVVLNKLSRKVSEKYYYQYNYCEEDNKKKERKHGQKTQEKRPASV